LGQALERRERREEGTRGIGRGERSGMKRTERQDSEIFIKEGAARGRVGRGRRKKRDRKFHRKSMKDTYNLPSAMAWAISPTPH
jgi:hypothetical protein